MGSHCRRLSLLRPRMPSLRKRVWLGLGKVGPGGEGRKIGEIRILPEL